MSTLLSVRSVSKRFGGYKALDAVSCDIEVGTVHSVIGPNGAGKSTLFNIISGVAKPNSGTVHFNGEGYGGRRPDKIVKMGIARNFQQVRLFPGLTAIENVMIGAHVQVGNNWRSRFAVAPGRGREARMKAIASEAIEFVGLGSKTSRMPQELTLVDQRRLEIARALASTPRLLLLDEPAAGMNPTEVEDFVRLLGSIQARNVTVLLVEHNMRLVMSVAEKVTVLAAGRVISEGSPRDIQRDEAVIAAYLGNEK